MPTAACEVRQRETRTADERVEAGTLVISDDIQRLLPRLLPDGTTTIEEVEARFQRLASASLGDPGALADGPLSSEVAATLLILRECMHHLGLAYLMIDEATARAQ